MVRRHGSAFVMEAERIDMEFDGRRSAVVMGRDVTRQREMFARMALAERMLSVATLATGVAHEINNTRLAFVGTNVKILAAELDTVCSRTVARGSPEMSFVLSRPTLRRRRCRPGQRDRPGSALPRSPRGRPARPHRCWSRCSSPRSRWRTTRSATARRVVESFEAGLPEVHGHASRLGQVFLNLLVNAGVFQGDRRRQRGQERDPGDRATRLGGPRSPSRSPTPVAGSRERASSESSIRSTRRRIPVRKPGLPAPAISHQIVSAMDGEITVDSTPGRARRFASPCRSRARRGGSPGRADRKRAPARRARPLHRRRARTWPLAGRAPGARDRGRRGDARS